MLGTSFIGSYLFVRGWSIIFGGWPSEISIFVGLRSGEHLVLTWSFYVYFVVTLVLFAITSYFQQTRIKNHEKNLFAVYLVNNMKQTDDSYERA